MKDFPILHGDGQTIPYELVKQHEQQVMVNHGGQTVEKICERGGLDWVELFCVLNDMSFDKFISSAIAKDRVLKKINIFKEKSIYNKTTNRIRGLRPCVVKLDDDSNDFEVNAYFHGWCIRSRIVNTETIVDVGEFFDSTVGIIEYEDGTIDECDPKNIRFTDKGVKKYGF